MKKHLQLTRATLHLQAKGFLVGATAPASLSSVSRAIQKYYGTQATLKRIQKWQLVANFCDKEGVILSAKRPKIYKRLATKKDLEKNILGSVTSDAFLLSYEWRRVRMEVLKRDGASCLCCGATPKDGVKMHVDHIKPRRKFPELALNKDNLQVLCEVCNHGKGNWDQTDWRKSEPANDELEEYQVSHIRSIVGVGI